MKVESSRDYGMFKRMRGNRPAHPRHVRSIASAYAANPDSAKYNPILVNEKFEVVDGQHRLEALKSLGLEVYYLQVPGLGLRDVQRLNQNARSWRAIDFARSFAELGNKNYQMYMEFREEYLLTHTLTVMALTLSRLDSEGTRSTERFRNEEFVVLDLKQAHAFIRDLLEVGQIYQNFRAKAFALAFLQLWRSPDYNQEHFITQLMKRAHTIGRRAKTADYAEALNAVYN